MYLYSFYSALLFTHCVSHMTSFFLLTSSHSPKALLLHLKRFIVEQQKDWNGTIDITMRKNKAAVELSRQLALDDFRGENLDKAAEKESRYSMSSLVYHVGTKSSSGHYTATASRLNRDGESTDWVTYDDSSTCFTTLDDITASAYGRKNAYMLLYTLDEGMVVPPTATTV